MAAPQPLQSILSMGHHRTLHTYRPMCTAVWNPPVGRIKDEVAADPVMPETAAAGSSTDYPADREGTTAEIFIQEMQTQKEEQEQAGTVHTDIALRSKEQRRRYTVPRTCLCSTRANLGTLPPLAFMPCCPGNGPLLAGASPFDTSVCSCALPYSDG